LSLLQGDAAAARSVFEKSKNPLGLALAEHDLGHGAESKHALDQLIAVHAKDYAYGIASVYAWTGDRDQAFAWLDRAVSQHDTGLLNLKFDPLLRGLRDDPRYAALLKRLKLPE
jgi:serine/threonine-protein kinase